MRPMQQAEPYIVCDNLVKIYQTEDLEVVALQGLSLIHISEPTRPY